MRIYFERIGCRENEAEIESMAAETVARGHEIASAARDADWIVINSCTVTMQGERDSRQKIRRAHARNAAARIAVTGCWATMEPERVAALPGVTRVIPNAEKERLIAGILDHDGRLSADSIRLPHTARRRTRAHIKVQDGCDNTCAYCITRLARGPVRSRTEKAVVADVLAAEEAGVKEAVLTGVHLGAWGKDLGYEFDLERLLKTLLARTQIPRLRLSSIEPWDLPPDFFRLWENRRLCPHLHLPLQSGCAATLRRMNRRTTPEEFANIADAARAAIPDLAVTSDLMAGFPGEDDAEFRDSLDFVERMHFARLHVFRFSARPGTAAARMPDAVPPQVLRRRADRARQAGRRAAEHFARTFLGRETDVLWERNIRCGMLRGLTGNYLRVRVKSDTIKPNTITKVRLTDYDQGEVIGEVA